MGKRRSTNRTRHNGDESPECSASDEQQAGEEEELQLEQEFYHRQRLEKDGLFKDEFFATSHEVLNKVANRTYFTVVVYDIVDNKRRAKLAKLLESFGDRVQYSGFEAHLTQKQIDTLTAKIKKIIDVKTDKVRIYKIAGEPQVTIFGSILMTEKIEYLVL